MRPGVSVQSANSEISTIQKRLLSNYTDAHVRQQRSDARVQSYADSLVAADLRKALLALLAASGVLWLIAAVNATNLMLARGAAREREIAMRRALGAGPWRIAQQFLAEGLVLSGAATLFGVGLALGAVRLSQSFVPSQLHVNLSIQVNIAILAILCALTFVTAIVSSAWPAFLAVRAPIEPALRQGSTQSGTARGHKRIRSALVAVEVAMSLALLVSCGLLLRTIYSLRHVPLGFRTDHIIVADLAIPTYRYQGQNVIANLYQPLLDRVKQVNGIQDAGLMSSVPLGPGIHINLGLAQTGKSIINTSLQACHTWHPAASSSGFPMLAGRYFNDGDIATSSNRWLWSTAHSLNSTRPTRTIRPH